MSNFFKTSLLVVLVVLIGSIAVSKKKTEAPRLGLSQENEGREHIEQEESRDYKNKLPTSGPHASPVSWGVYDKELESKNLIHNMEHGGIVVSYQPNADKQTISKLKSLFDKPYSNSTFRPTKAVVMPRSNQDKLITLTSWDRIYTLDNYDEQKLIDFYNKNIGRSPEPTAN